MNLLEVFLQEESPTRASRAWVNLRLKLLGSRSLVAAFCGYGLRNLAYQEWLKIGLVASPF